MSDPLFEAVAKVDAHLDASATGPYAAQPLAQSWARVTKVCEESGEVWQEWSRFTGENPRKGRCGSLADVLTELGDTVSAGLCAIQHLTKDAARTEEIVRAALAKAVGRVCGEAGP